MLLACFVLFGVGVFPARYLKETFGMDPLGDNAVLQLGAWVWIHVGSFILCLAILWVGMSHVITIRDEPRLPCKHYSNSSLVRMVRIFHKHANKSDGRLQLSMDNKSHEVFLSAINPDRIINGSKSGGKGKVKDKVKDKKVKDNKGKGKDNETTIPSEACEASESAIMIHTVFGVIAVVLFHAAFVGGAFVPPESRGKAIVHFVMGYGGHVFACKCN